MNREPVLEFLSLLESVERGERDATEAAAICDAGHRDAHPEDGYCLYNLQTEFCRAFSYKPGRSEAFVPILSLARKIAQYHHDDTLILFREPEWEELVGMRGPVEAMELRVCGQCGARRPAFMLSGFLEAIVAACDSCGSVLFQDLYDDRPWPQCACGGQYSESSPRCHVCGSRDSSREPASSYRYFSDHTWRWRERGD